MTAHPFVRQVAALCRAHPRREKWLVAPSHAAGHALGETIAREGTPWSNLRVVTPLDLALRMAGPWLVERGLAPDDESRGPASVMRLLRDLRVTPGYFQALADQPAMATALWRALRELRLAGLPADALPPAAFVPPGKHGELRALATAYERHLAGAALADGADVFALARAHPAFCPVRAADLLIEWPAIAWPPVVRRFLDALPGERVEAHGLVPAGADPGDHARRWGAPARPMAPAPLLDAARLAWLREVETAPPPAHDGSLQLFHAGGRHAELDEVTRRILAAGQPLDRVEIACATDDHAWLAWETCVRLGWPVTVSAGVPVAATTPARALFRWIDWVDGRFSAAAMRRLLLSGTVAPAAFGARGDADRLSAGAASRLVAAAEPTWGRDTWARALGAYALVADREAADATRDEAWRARRAQRAVHARRLGAWVASLLADVPDEAEGSDVPLGRLIAAARGFVVSSALVRGPIDAMARDAVLQALDALAPIADEPWPPSAALRLVRGQVEALRVGRDRARPGHLHVSTLATDACDARSLVFVVGLEEGAVFPGGLEDAVLLDEERQAIGAAAGDAALLATSGDRQRAAVEQRLARLAAIGCAAERVTLSYSCRDLRQFRDSHPSWVLLQAMRLAEGDPGIDDRGFRARLGEAPVSSLPAEAARATTAAGWWVWHGRRTRDAREAVLRAYPALAAGEAAAAARAGLELTACDGFVPEAAALDPSRTGRAVSVSQLEKIARCPYAWFLEQALGVEGVDDAEPDADVWLDALTRGSELHALYAALLRRARDEGRRVSTPPDRRWFDAEVERTIARLRHEIPPPSEVVFEHEAQELRLDARHFLDLEAAATGVETVGIELSFGTSLDESSDPLARADTLDLDLGGGRRVRVRGRMDRLNRLGPGRYEVVDYKTGGFRPDEYDGIFAGGRRLQPMIYGLAADDLLRAHDPAARVVRGAYAFPTGRGDGEVKAFDLPPAQETRDVVRAVLDVVAAGTFVPAAGGQPCRFCELARACATADSAEGKLDPALAAVTALWRIR